MAQATLSNRPTVKRFCSRLEAARILSMSVQGVHKLEHRGLLRAVPIKDAHGYVRKTSPGRQPQSVLRWEDVQRLKDDEYIKRLNSGDLASECWKLFRAGSSVVDAVIKLRLTPERAEQMFQQYKANVGGLTVPSFVVDEMRALGFAVDADNFVPTIQRLLRAVRDAKRGGNAPI